MLKLIKTVTMTLAIVSTSIETSFSTYYECPDSDKIKCKIEQDNKRKSITYCHSDTNWHGAFGSVLNLPIAFTWKGPHVETTLNINTCTYTFDWHTTDDGIIELSNPDVEHNHNCYVSSNPKFHRGWTCP